MKILLVGSGGREDALAWALGRSPSTRVLRCAPGNAGMARRGEIVPIAADDVASLTRHAVDERYDLVVVGPEAPLALGLADRLREHGLAVFGPSAGAAEIESSKVYAKQLMERHGIPSAEFRVFDDPDDARRYLLDPGTAYPLVVKADGLAAGKGVVVAAERSEAVEAAVSMLQGRSLGAAGSTIIVEEALSGREVSFFYLSDGEHVVELDTCQDYKRAFDGDRGPNTGGMGAYSPSAYVDGAIRSAVRERIAERVVRALATEGRPYQGVLYVGAMLTAQGAKVLEFNARFGDPETQVLLPRLDEDWLPLLLACATGKLGRHAIRWKTDAAVCVVMASGGYPGSYAKGHPILGTAEAEALDGVLVFHAGTNGDARNGFETAGGRVLGVTAVASRLAAARERAYAAVSRIRWSDEHHRADIALDAVRELEGRVSR